MRGLYAAKAWYSRRLAPVTRTAVRHGWSPDAFTAAGVLAAAGAAAAIVGHHGVLVAPLLALRLAGANLDGAVARARGVSRPWGFVVNELGDRISDIVVIVAVAMTGHPALALAAGLAATLPTFASLAGAAAGAQRLNGGPFGKTERCAAIAVGAVVPAWWSVLLAVIVAGSVLTAAARLVAVHRQLTTDGRPGSGQAVGASSEVSR